jgi:hypothetical protein
MTSLNKTLGYDVALRSGEAVLHKTLTNRTKPLEQGIAEDLNFLFGQAGAAGVTVQQTVAMSRLTGYLRELAFAMGAVSQLGFTFESRDNPDGSKTLSVLVPKRAS